MAAEHGNTLQGEARLAGVDLEDFLDLEFEASCTREEDEGIALDRVREATSSIPGSMSEAIVKDERADRF